MAPPPSPSTSPSPAPTAPRRALVLAELKKQGVDVTLPPGIDPDNDAVLASSFARAPVVAGFAISNETKNPLPIPKAGFAFGGADPKTYLPSYSGGAVDLPVLNAAATGIGFFSFPLAADGIVRELPVVASAQGNLYPALSVEALRVAQGAGSFAVRTTGASGEADTGVPAMTAFKAGALSMPTGPLGEFRIYYSGLKSVPMIPARDLLDPAQQASVAAKVNGRIVLDRHQRGGPPRSRRHAVGQCHARRARPRRNHRSGHRPAVPRAAPIGRSAPRSCSPSSSASSSSSSSSLAARWSPPSARS